jgi:hypothetical protein
MHVIAGQPHLSFYCVCFLVACTLAARMKACACITHSFFEIARLQLTGIYAIP